MGYSGVSQPQPLIDVLARDNYNLHDEKLPMVSREMINKVEEIDNLSDELVAVYTDQKKARSERQKAAEELYRLHRSWVAREISKRVRNAADVEDIAQTVWMKVLDPTQLQEKYTNRCGRFRGFLINPIKWNVGNYYESLRTSPRTESNTDDSGSREIEDEERMETVTYEDTVEGIIKPFLNEISPKPRTAYVASEYGAMFVDVPGIAELSLINGILEKEVKSILEKTQSENPSTFTPDEMAVYLPGNYNKLVNREDLDRNSTRHLSSIMCISESAFRKNLSIARKKIIEYVRSKIEHMDIGGLNHG